MMTTPGPPVTTSTGPGTQVVYVPYDGAPEHTWEYGFTEDWPQAERVTCRYWRKGQPGCLRTKANGEATAISRLYRKDSFPQELVNLIWEEL